MTETEIWTRWETQIVNGVFPLRRYLGRSGHSVVFLTEYPAQNISTAAIKLVPANLMLTELQLAQWRTIAALSHPHLVRLFEVGHCMLGGHPFLFVVMEYAEQTLAQILPHRALSAAELREMLVPTLDALSFLHGKGLVQGQLKPPNILVVNDQLKLASDTVRAADGETNAAADIFGLGGLMIEALTQRPPQSPIGEPQSDPPPPAVPSEFADTVQRCLNLDPAERPTLDELLAQFKPAPPAKPAPEPRLRDASARMLSKAGTFAGSAFAKARAFFAEKSYDARLATLAIAASVVVIAAIWAGVHFLRSLSAAELPAANQAQKTALPAAAITAIPENSKGSAALPAFVVHQEIPEMSQSARQSISGTIKVTIRVTVDAAGNVVSETVERHGPSNYFARLAADAARKWRFAPADNQDARKWLLQFEFSRGGTAAHVVSPRP